MIADTGDVTLRTNLGDHPVFMPIKSGTLKVPTATFDFCGPKSPPSGFKDMVRRGAYDVGELALGTFLQAVHFGKPVVLLPVTITARFQHGNIVRRSDTPIDPNQAAGKRIGVRSYTQTTGIWVRGILEESYGVDPESLTWVCTEDAHLAEYVDPPNVERVAVASDQMANLLAEGRIDAAIFGADLPKEDARFAPLIEDADAAALAWYVQRRYVPINHMLAVSRELVERRPDVVRGIYAAFADAAAAAPRSAEGIDFLPRGFDAVRPSIEAMIEHAVSQKIIPHRLSFNEIFSEARRVLES